MKMTLDEKGGSIEIGGEVPSFASGMVLTFEPTLDNTMEAVEFYFDQKVKAASSEAVTEA